MVWVSWLSLSTGFRLPILRIVVPVEASHFMKTRTSSSLTLSFTSPIWLPGPSLGIQASIFPSSCLKWKEHMKKMQRQKITSTIAVTLISTGLSDASPMFWLPPMAHSLSTQGLHGLGEADGGQFFVLAEVDDVDDV